MNEMAAQMVPVFYRLLDQGIATLCTVALLCGLAWHFWKLKPTMEVQNQLIANNTAATQALCKSVDTISVAMIDVSKRLVSHDERTGAMQQHVTLFHGEIQEVGESLQDLREKVASRESLARMHARMDELQQGISKDMADMQKDVAKIAGKLGV